MEKHRPGRVRATRVPRTIRMRRALIGALTAAGLVGAGIVVPAVYAAEATVTQATTPIAYTTVGASPEVGTEPGQLPPSLTVTPQGGTAQEADVTWNLDGVDFTTAIQHQTVTGTAHLGSDTATVTATVIAVPQNLAYLIDVNSLGTGGKGSTLFTWAGQHVTGLVNTVADQTYSGSNGFGWVSETGAGNQTSDISGKENAADYATTWLGDTNDTAGLQYTVNLTAGQYRIYTAVVPRRTMDQGGVAVSVLDASSTQLSRATAEVTATTSLSHPPVIVTNEVSVPVDGAITIDATKVRSSGGFNANVSLIVIERLTVEVPTITPAGGVFAEEEAPVVTLSVPEGTTVHYTLDGTTPTQSSPRYDGPFTMTASATLTAAAFAGGSASATTSASFTILTPYEQILPGDDLWIDTEGEGIKAHGGAVAQVEESVVDIDFDGDGAKDKSIWLWYGENKTNATRPVDGINGYWSTDLMNWHNMGTVFPTHTTYPVVPNADSTAVVVDEEALSQFKATANLTAPAGDVTQDEIDVAKAFIAPYVTQWENEELGIASAYDEELLAEAFKRGYGYFNIIERPKILYNETTNQFVLVYHSDSPADTNADLISHAAKVAAGTIDPDTTWTSASRYGRAEVGFAVSASPFGPFKLVNTTRMNYDMSYHATRFGESRDFTVFVDEGVDSNNDGVDDAYVVYSSEMNAWMYASLLDGTYTELDVPYVAPDGAEITKSPGEGTSWSARILPDQAREASALFKYNGYYYMITSGTDGWNSTEVIYYRSTSVLPAVGQQWEKVATLLPGTKGGDSQPTYVIPFDQDKGQFIYMGDRWKTSAVTGSADETSRYVWYPIQLNENNTIDLNQRTAWSPTDESLYRDTLTVADVAVGSLVGQPVQLPATVTPQWTDTGAGNPAAVTWDAADVAAISTDASGGPYTVAGSGVAFGVAFTVSASVTISDSLAVTQTATPIAYTWVGSSPATGTGVGELPTTMTVQVEGGVTTDVDVTWDIASHSFDTPLVHASVTGTVTTAGYHGTVTATIIAVPENPAYLVDVNSLGTGGQGSDLFTWASQHAAALVNTVADQTFTGSNGFGWITEATAGNQTTDIAGKENAADYATTWLGDTNDTAGLQYSFQVPAGEYRIYTAVVPRRTMDQGGVAVSVLDSSGTQLARATAEVTATASLSHPPVIVVNDVTVAADGIITIDATKVRSSGGYNANISLIVIEDLNPEPEPEPEPEFPETIVAKVPAAVTYRVGDAFSLAAASLVITGTDAAGQPVEIDQTGLTSNAPAVFTKAGNYVVKITYTADGRSVTTSILVRVSAKALALTS